MECAGLTIALLEPPLPRRVGVGRCRIAAMVTLGCGCPVTAGGRWDGRRFRVKGLVEGPDGRIQEVALRPVEGRPSEFACHAEIPAPGRYSLTIEAVDPESGRAGRLREEIEAV